MNGMNDNPSVRWLPFTPSGRIGRQAYLLSVLLWLMLQGAAVFSLLAVENTSKAGLLFTALALVIMSAAACVSYIMLSIKRLHDMGFPAPFVLMLFIPAVNFLVFFLVLLWPSSPPNDFGQHPDRPK